MNCLPPEIVRHVAGTCLCLHAQRAARALARLFDAALGPCGLTSGQFSLLMSLNTPQPPTISRLAEFLAMDRTSLTAALKPLQRRGLVLVDQSDTDRRARMVAITPAGLAALTGALPVWRATHARLDAALSEDAPNRLRSDLKHVPSAATAVARPGPRPVVR